VWVVNGRGGGGARKQVYMCAFVDKSADKLCMYPMMLQSFKFVIESWGKSFSQEEKTEIINQFRGPTNFKVRYEAISPCYSVSDGSSMRSSAHWLHTLMQ
jgi:hypothetical protein